LTEAATAAAATAAAAATTIWLFFELLMTLQLTSVTFIRAKTAPLTDKNSYLFKNQGLACLSSSGRVPGGQGSPSFLKTFGSIRASSRQLPGAGSSKLSG